MKGPTGVLACALTLLLIVSTVIPVVHSQVDEPWWWPTQGEWVETQAFEPEDVQDLKFRLNFGSHVVVDGDTLVTSTQYTIFSDHWFRCPGLDRPTDHPEFEDGCDWVYVFNRGADGAWEQTTKLVPSDAQPGDTFGWALAVDEEAGVIVVGNPGPANNPGEIRPPAMVEPVDKVYIFERQPNGSWVETATIHKSYPEPDVPYERLQTRFGAKVAVSGRTVAVADAAAVLLPDGSFIIDTRAYVFEEVDGEWVETAAVDGSSHGLALSGDTLVTAPLFREPRDCSSSKRVYLQVYNRVGGEWVTGARIDPQAEYGNRTQTSVSRVAMSEDGTTIVIGAAVDRRVYGVHTEHCAAVDAPAPVGEARVHTRGGALGAVGSAWIYELVDGQWVQTADIPNPMPSGDHPVFGVSVDVSGDIAVIGANGDTYNGGHASGAAYVYEKAEGEWLLTAKLRNHDSDENDVLGNSVSVSGGTVVVGAPWNTQAGTAHAFEPMGPTTNVPLPTG